MGVGEPSRRPPQTSQSGDRQPAMPPLYPRPPAARETVVITVPLKTVRSGPVCSPAMQRRREGAPGASKQSVFPRPPFGHGGTYTCGTRDSGGLAQRRIILETPTCACEEAGSSALVVGEDAVASVPLESWEPPSRTRGPESRLDHSPSELSRNHSPSWPQRGPGKGADAPRWRRVPRVHSAIPTAMPCDGREETEVDGAWLVFSRSRARNRASVAIRV